MNKRKETIPELFRQLMRVRAVFRQAMLKKLKENNIEMTFEMLQIMHALWLDQGISQQTLAFNTVRDKASLTSFLIVFHSSSNINIFFSFIYCKS